MFVCCFVHFVCCYQLFCLIVYVRLSFFLCAFQSLSFLFVLSLQDGKTPIGLARVKGYWKLAQLLDYWDWVSGALSRVWILLENCLLTTQKKIDNGHLVTKACRYLLEREREREREIGGGGVGGGGRWKSSTGWDDQMWTTQGDNDGYGEWWLVGTG